MKAQEQRHRPPALKGEKASGVRERSLAFAQSLDFVPEKSSL